jgi:hypothetical protein
VTGRTDDQPLHLWASTDVLAAVVDVELAVFLGRPPAKDDTLNALAARRELEDRMRRHLWLAMETARKAGATWAEIGVAADMDAQDAQCLCEGAPGRPEGVRPGGTAPPRSRLAGAVER